MAKLMDEMAVANHDLTDLSPEILTLKAKTKLFIKQAGDNVDPETIKSLTLLTEQIRRMIETINNKKFQASITKDVFDTIMYRMGEVVSKYITDEQLLQQIAEEWTRIRVDTKPKRNVLAAGSIRVEAIGIE